MLQNAYFLAKIGADTAENEQHFAEIPEILPKTAASVVLLVQVPGPGAGRRWTLPGGRVVRLDREGDLPAIICDLPQFRQQFDEQ